MHFELVQDVGDGEVIALTDVLAVREGSTEPAELPVLQDRLDVGRPIYLRIHGFPFTSPAPWWQTAHGSPVRRLYFTALFLGTV